MIKYDLEIIKRCLKRDRKAQNELYRNCYNIMMSISWRYAKSKDEAIELMNAGFLKVIINLKKYNEEVPFEYWLRRVVINEVIDQLRKDKRYKEIIDIREEHRLPEVIVDEDISYGELEKIELIKSKSKDLPNMTQKVFKLYAFDGYKHAEIAEILNMSIGTSHWHYAEAKKLLKKWLVNNK